MGVKGQKQATRESKKFWLSDVGLAVIRYYRGVKDWSEEKIADKMGIAYSTLRKWKDEESALSAALNTDKASLIATAFGALVTSVEAAQRGDIPNKVTVKLKETWKDGQWVSNTRETTTEKSPVDTKDAKYILQNFDPEHFKDKVSQEVTGADGGPVQIETLTSDDLDARIKELQAKLGKDK